MILTIYTAVHVIISLLGIFSGFVVLFGLFAGKRLDGWTKFFLATTVATSVTGFFFPVHHFMPSHGVGILSLLVLAVAIYARYARHLGGCLAQDLRDRRCLCTLPECLRRDRAILPENTRAQSDGSDAIRAAI